jgi:hypothetical protein
MHQYPKSKKSTKRRRERLIGWFFDLLLTIFASAYSMPVILKVLLWLVAWLLFLYLVFTSFEALEQKGLTVKIGRSVILTTLVAFVFWTPLHEMWCAEKSRATEGDLVPQGKSVYPRGMAPPIDAGEGSQSIEAKSLQLLYDAGIIPEWGNNGPEISTTVRDKSGNVIVEIKKNHWRTSSRCWDKNYTDDTLEVEDSRGHVVLQVKIFPEKISLQGLWYDDTGHGIEIFKSPDPSRPGTLVYMTDRAGGRQPPEYLIQPIFLYPSKDYWGELRK